MARITVEDCLEKEPNRFALVILASLRAKQLLNGATALSDSEGNKPLVTALREVADNKVRWMTPEEEETEARLEEERAMEAQLAAPTNGQTTPANGSAAPTAMPPAGGRLEGEGSDSSSDS